MSRESEIMKRKQKKRRRKCKKGITSPYRRIKRRIIENKNTKEYKEKWQKNRKELRTIE